ncbi:MAG: outer membrane protein assembly factor BamD [Myxococcota bacterium]
MGAGGTDRVEPPPCPVVPGTRADKVSYEEARRALGAGEFDIAVAMMHDLEARFPTSPYARQVQLDAAYAHYKANQPDAALEAIDRFLRLNPRDPCVDYAWYLRGLTNFNRGDSWLDRMFSHNPAQRDPKSLRAAFDDFATLVRQHPDSRYAVDGHRRLTHLQNKLAAHEMAVADYYMKREAYLAAANRGQYLIEHYPQAPARIRALQVMIEAYTKLGMDDLAQDARAVLALNHPVDPGTVDAIAATSGPAVR